MIVIRVDNNLLDNNNNNSDINNGVCYDDSSVTLAAQLVALLEIDERE